MLRDYWEKEEFEEEEDIFEELEDEPEKPYAHALRMILVEGAVLLLVILMIAGYRYIKNAPEQLVEEFVQGSVQHRWNEVYDSLYFKDAGSEFLTKKMFVSARELNEGDVEIVHSKVKRVKESKKDGSLYHVDYIKNEETLTEEVPLTKTKGRWWVNGDKKFVEKNVRIRVPEGAAVSYDSITLDKKYVKETKKGKDTYELPVTFDGTHYIKVEKKGMGNAERIVNLNPEEIFDVSLQYDPEILKKAGTQALTDIKAQYQKAEIGRTKFIGLKLFDNHITAKTVGKDGKTIEVTIESQYEYRYKPNKYYRMVRKEKGSVKNVVTYSYDGKNFKQESVKLEHGFLKKDEGQR